MSCDLAVVVLRGRRCRCPAGRRAAPPLEARGVFAERGAAAAGFDADQLHGGVVEEGVEERRWHCEPPPTQAMRRSGRRPSFSRIWRRASSPMTRWKSRTMIGIRMRAERGAEDVVRGADVGDPVAHGFVDGVLERLLAGGDADAPRRRAGSCERR